MTITIIFRQAGLDATGVVRLLPVLRHLTEEDSGERIVVDIATADDAHHAFSLQCAVRRSSESDRNRTSASPEFFARSCSCVVSSARNDV